MLKSIRCASFSVLVIKKVLIVAFLSLSVQNKLLKRNILKLIYIELKFVVQVIFLSFQYI